MKKWLILLAITSFLIVLAGCEEAVEDPLEDEVEEEEIIEDEVDAPDNEHEAIKAVVEQNMEATENEDAQGVLQTMHEDSPGYDEEAITTELEDLFEYHDLEYELEILDIRIKNGEAAVDFQQITRSVDNDDFNDNQITGVHIMRQQNGEWRIYDSQVEETELLE